MSAMRQILLALLSGLLVCVSFPTMVAGVGFPEMGWLAWVALVPLVLAIRRASPRRSFLLAFVSGLVLYGGSIFWIYSAVHTYGRMPAATSAIVLFLLIVVVSACAALAPALARFMETRQKGELIVWLPVAWTAVEILRNYFPCNGFPWSNIAVSQWRLLPVIQIADLVGIYGVAFLIVWVNVFLAECVARFSGDKTERFVPKAATTAVLVAATLLYGAYRLHAVPAALAGSPSMSLGLIQGNVDQGEKWAKELAQRNLDMHREGARRLAESFVEMIIWPEAAFPWPIETTDTVIDPRVLGLAEGGTGSLPYTLMGVITETPEENFHNSAVLFDGGGEIEGMYHKAHLVPFGEYVPYSKILFFARKLTSPVGNFEAGSSSEPLSAGGRKLGVLICYEDVFPEIARAETAAGAGFLVNITNDAWYGRSSAPFQHLAISVFRAVENRRFLVRAANSGVSAVVMPTGEITVESPIFEPALVVTPVAVFEELSPYTRLGDWFAWACVAYAALGVVVVAARRIKRRG